jgi:hypothetical protein
MHAERFFNGWLMMAVVYLVVGVGFGVYMGASGDHSLYTVHSHIGLLGWTSMGLMGLLYRAVPEAARTRPAAWHFWLYQIAVPVMLVAVACVRSGVSKAGPIAGISSVAILVSVLFFAWAMAAARKGAPSRPVE